MSFDSVISIVGAVVPVLSAVASFVNHVVRVQVEAGKAPHALLLALGGLLNVGALNVDKSIQFVKMARSFGAFGAKEEEKQE